MLPPKFLNHSLSNSTVNFDRFDLINKPKPQRRHLLRSDQGQLLPHLESERFLGEFDHLEVLPSS
ncbi:hypothetical protein LINPERPRIM_LOCUS40367 [Linum perenne]